MPPPNMPPPNMPMGQPSDGFGQPPPMGAPPPGMGNHGDGFGQPPPPAGPSPELIEARQSAENWEAEAQRYKGSVWVWTNIAHVIKNTVVEI